MSELEANSMIPSIPEDSAINPPLESSAISNPPPEEMDENSDENGKNDDGKEQQQKKKRKRGPRRGSQRDERREKAAAKAAEEGGNSNKQKQQQQRKRGNQNGDGDAAAADGGGNGETYEANRLKEEVSQFDYVFTKEFRIVPPYHFAFSTNTKERWVGRQLLEVYVTEFPYYSRDYYAKAIQNGNLLVDHQPSTATHPLHNSDIVTHRIHRHEPPVLPLKINVLFQNDEWVVVDKPTSVPVHPGGRYRRNTVVAILAKEHSLFGLHPVHRLDRLTSGVLIIAKSAKMAETFRRQQLDRDCRKFYLARVKGVPSSEWTEVDVPIKCASKGAAVYDWGEGGKEAKTFVKMLVTNGEESIVLCEILHGRTHQIRLHLKYLQFPIMNDPLYGPDSLPPAEILRIFNEKKQKGASGGGDGWSEDEEEEEEKGEGGGAEGGEGAKPREPKRAKVRMAENSEDLDLELRGWFDEKCAFCQQCKKTGIKGYCVPTKRVNDDSSVMSLYLHALSYSGTNWAYNTPPPSWATELDKENKILSLLTENVRGYEPGKVVSPPSLSSSSSSAAAAAVVAVVENNENKEEKAASE